MSGDCKRTLEITIPFEEVEEVRQRVLTNLASKASLPGFRPGKVPKGVIRSQFAEQVKQETLDQVLSHAFNKKATELELDVVSTPNVKDLTFEEGQPVVFTAEFEVRPVFELQDYVGMEVPYAEPVVTDEDVDSRIESMRERRAELVNVDPRPVEKGDFAVISLKSLSPVGTEEPISQDEMNLEVGGEYTLPEFTENVLGMQQDETREFDVVYPEDYSGTNLAGRTVRFSITLKGIRKREFPELNDEFAQDMGDYKTFDEFREAVRGSLLAEREFVARDNAKAAIGEKLGESYDFPVPDAFVDQQVETMLRRQIRQLADQGADVANLQIDWKKAMEEQREPASKIVRASLVLDRIATAESVEVSQAEVEAEVERAAKRERISLASVRERLEKDGGLVRIAQQMRSEKTLNLLFEKGTKVVPPEPPAVAEPEPAAEASSEA